MSEAENKNVQIDLTDIGIAFGKGDRRVQVLEGVNLQVQQGEFVSLIGHSGCGKSTLLKMVAGFEVATEGNILVAGHGVSKPGPDRMMVFQNHSLLPWMTVRQNVDLAAKSVHKDMDREARIRKVDDMLELVGLAHAADKRPGEVSGGMKQRAGIARALITEPEVLLMDEPFGALDALTRGKLQESLLDIWERHRITVLMVTHDVDEAVLLSDKIVMMSNGPNADIAEVLEVELPRPRKRLEAVNHPLYYPTRNRVTHFLSSHRKDRPVEVSDDSVLRLGYIPLADCAPLLYAKEKGLFEEAGLNVELSREPSWRSLSKGLMSGRLKGAMMLAPTPMYHNARHAADPGQQIKAGMVLSRNGNGITISSRLAAQGLETREALCEWIKSRPEGQKPVFGVVFRSSMHNLMLRAWLRQGGVDPDVDCELAVVPPPQMVANLELGNLAGMCVGEPWNSYAVERGVGAVMQTSDGFWPRHPEKLFCYLDEWAKGNSDLRDKLLLALMKSTAALENPAERALLPELLSPSLGIPAATLAPSLKGMIDPGLGRDDWEGEFHIFSAGDSTVFKAEEELWLGERLKEEGLPEDGAAPLQSVFDQPAFQRVSSQLGLSGQESMARTYLESPMPLETLRS